MTAPAGSSVADSLLPSDLLLAIRGWTISTSHRSFRGQAVILSGKPSLLAPFTRGEEATVDLSELRVIRDNIWNTARHERTPLSSVWPPRKIFLRNCANFAIQTVRWGSKTNISIDEVRGRLVSTFAIVHMRSFECFQLHESESFNVLFLSERRKLNPQQCSKWPLSRATDHIEGMHISSFVIP